MTLISGIGDLLKQYTGNSPKPADVEQHFDQVAQSVPSSSLASGLAEALRSGQTPAFSQLAGKLFASGNGTQQASMLSGLMAAAGPSAISMFTGNNPNSPLAALLKSGQTAATADQAASIPAADVEALAHSAHADNPSIIDRMSEIYAQHPALVKSLGAAAMAVAVKKIAEQHAA
jgi:hypothetical protein